MGFQDSTEMMVYTSGFHFLWPYSSPNYDQCYKWYWSNAAAFQSLQPLKDTFSAAGFQLSCPLAASLALADPPSSLLV